MITRRDFLKIGTTVSLFAFLPVSQLLKSGPVEAEFNGRFYRGAINGNIYVSVDKRKSWKQHMKLGAGCVVSNFQKKAGKKLYAEVDYQGYSFRLALAPNGKDWLVA